MGSTTQPPTTTFTVRTHRPGDIGWIIHRHGVLYNQEYGWDERFESIAAHIAADFIDNYDPKREAYWIAERDGQTIGGVMLMKDRNSEAAKIRLLLVEPSARGLGVGSALVRQCVEFAREVGYEKIVLWTQSILTSARRLYGREGFVHVRSEEHASFGEKLVGEMWELQLEGEG